MKTKDGECRKKNKERKVLINRRCKEVLRKNEIETEKRKSW